MNESYIMNLPVYGGDETTWTANDLIRNQATFRKEWFVSAGCPDAPSGFSYKTYEILKEKIVNMSSEFLVKDDAGNERWINCSWFIPDTSSFCATNNVIKSEEKIINREIIKKNKSNTTSDFPKVAVLYVNGEVPEGFTNHKKYLVDGCENGIVHVVKDDNGNERQINNHLFVYIGETEGGGFDLGVANDLTEYAGVKEIHNRIKTPQSSGLEDLEFTLFNSCIDKSGSTIIFLEDQIRNLQNIRYNTDYTINNLKKEVEKLKAKSVRNVKEIFKNER